MNRGRPEAIYWVGYDDDQSISYGGQKVYTGLPAARSILTRHNNFAKKHPTYARRLIGPEIWIAEVTWRKLDA
jgi:hypothetical protein